MGFKRILWGRIRVFARFPGVAILQFWFESAEMSFMRPTMCDSAFDFKQHSEGTFAARSPKALKTREHSKFGKGF